MGCNMVTNLLTVQAFLSPLILRVYSNDDIGVAVGFGHPVTLPCSFSRTSARQLGSTVISWQHGEEVIHKFYHGRDQLDGQRSQYANRTSLFHSEILNGNASLRLEHPRIEDMGDYSCHVNTQLGNYHCHVKLAAPYSEPVLQFSARPGNVKLLLTSEGGFPAPTLHWLLGQEDITNSTETQLTRDTQSGLYVVSSTLILRGSSNATLTIILRNEDLLQEVRRNINLVSEYEDESHISSHSCPAIGGDILVPLMGFALILLTVVAFYLHKPCRQKICSPDQTKEIIHQA